MYQREYKVIRAHIGLAGVIGFLLGAFLAVMGERFIDSEDYDMGLLGILGAGFSITVSLLFSPIYIVLAGYRYSRLGVIIESALAQLLVFLVSWSIVFHLIASSP